MATPRPLTCLAALLVSILAGCTSPAPDELGEKWVFSVVAQEPYAIAFPMLLHDEGPDMTAWAVLWHASRGNATFHAIGDPGDQWIVVEANGTMTAEAHFDRRAERCCLEAYLDAAWSAPQPETGLRVQVLHGQTGTVSLQYEATSSGCWREANYHTAGTEGPGEVLLSGNDQSACPG